MIGASAQLPEALDQVPIGSMVELGCNDDQVDIAVGAGVPAGTRAIKNPSLRLDACLTDG
jgi:hypothetical protein